MYEIITEYNEAEIAKSTASVQLTEYATMLTFTVTLSGPYSCGNISVHSDFGGGV